VRYKDDVPQPLTSTAKIGPHNSDASNKKLLKNGIKKAKALKTADATTFCSTCNEPTICVDAYEKEHASNTTASAQFICRSGHITAFTDTRFSLEQECKCTITVNPVSSPLTPAQETAYRRTVAPAQRVLIITGFHNIHTANSNYLAKLAPALREKDIAFDVVDAENIDSFLVELLESGKYRTLLVLHLEHNGMTKKEKVFGQRGMGTLYNWVRVGGNFVLHGEGEGVAWLLQILTGKPWHFVATSIGAASIIATQTGSHHSQ
jgi:hypothetical protein